MVYFAAGFVLGIYGLQQLAYLPSLPLLPLLIAVQTISSILLRNSKFQFSFKALLLLLGISCGAYQALIQAEHRLEKPFNEQVIGKDIEVIGLISQLTRQHERGQRFVFDVEHVNNSAITLPKHIYLSTYDPSLHVSAGERWLFTVRLKPPHGSQNPNGYDFELWALENKIGAVGYIPPKQAKQQLQVAHNFYWIQTLRENIRSHFQQVLGERPYAGILIALVIGDQSSISPEQWQLFNRTGINHLMSISGLHITMLSGMMFWLTYQLWRRQARLTLALPARKAASLAALVTAVLYGLLAGFEVPAQRTVYMVATICIALLSNHRFTGRQILSLALIIVLLLDPWAVLAPGFWLSFSAVALIFYISAGRLKFSIHSDKTRLDKLKLSLVESIRVQWAMTLGLIPLLLALFQQISLVSPLANAVAIPLVSLILVPLTLLAALLPIEPLLLFCHCFLSQIMHFLEWLNLLPQAVWVQHTPLFWSILLGCIGILITLLPRGFPLRYYGFLLLLPMFAQTPVRPDFGTVKMLTLDVGQGLAVLIQTENHNLLYDTGPAFSSEQDAGNRILLPSLRAQGIKHIDTLILSHNDMDHIGGTKSIKNNFMVEQLLSSLPSGHDLEKNISNHQSCQAGQHWQWDGVNFQILYPLPEQYQTPTKKNNLSCVLLIKIGKHNILLTGDIEKVAERDLLAQYKNELDSDIMFIPHHGSKSSSSQEFLTAVSPNFAIISAGYRNQFKHPRPEILRRYQTINSQLFRTDLQGAITSTITPKSIQFTTYRQTHRRYWQHQTLALD